MKHSECNLSLYQVLWYVNSFTAKKRYVKHKRVPRSLSGISEKRLAKQDSPLDKSLFKVNIYETEKMPMGIALMPLLSSYELPVVASLNWIRV